MFIAIFQAGIGEREQTCIGMQIHDYRDDMYVKIYNEKCFEKTLNDGSSLYIYRRDEALIDDHGYNPGFIITTPLNNYADIIANIPGLIMQLNDHSIALLKNQTQAAGIRYVQGNQALKRLSLTHQGTQRSLDQREQVIQQAYDELNVADNGFTGLGQAIRSLKTVQNRIAAILEKLNQSQQARLRVRGVAGDLEDDGGANP
jgi:hypothetical protein